MLMFSTKSEVIKTNCILEDNEVHIGRSDTCRIRQQLRLTVSIAVLDMVVSNLPRATYLSCKMQHHNPVKL